MPAREIVSGFDTVSICFSKGLGCPMGSVLVGSAEDIQRARRIRKMMGGALRQAGVVAATALYALENNIERMSEDHANAKAFAEAVSKIDGISIDLDGVQSNLVFFWIDAEIGDAAQLAAALKTKGVKIGAMSSHKLRACTHLDVTREQVLCAAEAIGECLQNGIREFAPNPTGPFARA